MYESTIAPLRTLYPLVAPGGVIYIDDYGGYAGCGTAVHEIHVHTPSMCVFASCTSSPMVKIAG